MAKVEEKSTGQETLSDERLHELFREMLLIRRFEEKVEERFRAGELPGFLHVCIGQEAVASGVCAALQRDEHRDVPRVAQPRAALEGAGALRPRDECLGRVDADAPARSDRRLLAARGRLRDA